MSPGSSIFGPLSLLRPPGTEALPDQPPPSSATAIKCNGIKVWMEPCSCCRSSADRVDVRPLTECCHLMERPQRHIKQHIEQSCRAHPLSSICVLTQITVAFAGLMLISSGEVKGGGGWGGGLDPTCLQDNAWDSYKTAKKFFLGGSYRGTPLSCFSPLEIVTV
jgi:hypothetical protein